MTDRDRILADLPTSSTCGVGVPPAPLKDQVLDPWTLFQQRFTALGGEIIEFIQILHVANSFFTDATVQQTLPNRIANVWEAEAGVTTADLAIAETGSIILSAKPGSSRLASLAPPIHIILLDPKSIVPTLEDAMAIMPRETSVIITGPSRTADIEGVLVRGVHGPKRVIVALFPP